ncbi:MAG: Txe/YoeB family addiction module toxin [Saprospiraceae bacterium]|nr:Txe/YoeB family addiction module toxin [Saprospiraceae bacterium]
MNSYILRFSEQAKEDIRQHKKSGNKSVVNKITLLLEELVRHPFTGSGKPEPLKHNLSGAWSRRINREHRLVYEVTETIVFILSVKGHYN